MKNNENIEKINHKSNTLMLIDYLEGVIADEMILNSYIRELKIIDQTKNEITIKLPSVNSKKLVESEYIPQFNQAIEAIFDSKLLIKFVLTEEIYEISPKSANLGKNIAKKFVFSNYVQSNFNNEVVEIAKKTVTLPGKYSPFYIESKSGLGKTHLLHAIGNEYMKKGMSAIYIEPNKFTKDVTYFSKQTPDSMNTFIESLKIYDVLLFDDIQNLGDRSVTLKVLLEIINHQIENNKQIVIASDKVAQELSGFEPRFITRFISGMTSRIDQPTTEDITNVLLAKLKEENMKPEKWEKEALSFVARNNSSSIRALEGAIKRIRFYTEGDSTPQYTYNVVSSIFKDLIVDSSELTPSRIINFVCSYYKITKKDIIGKSRKQNIVIARHIAIYLVRTITNLGYIEIGKNFGGRDHSTIMSAVKKIERDMKITKAIKMAINSISVKIKKIS